MTANPASKMLIRLTRARIFFAQPRPANAALNQVKNLHRVGVGVRVGNFASWLSRHDSVQIGGALNSSQHGSTSPPLGQ